MPRMSPEERLWQTVVDEMIDEAASVSVEDAEAELRAAGFDVTAERARAEAFLLSLEHASADEAPVEAVPQEALAGRADRKKGRPVVLWAAAAAAVAAAAATAAYVAQRPEQATQPTPVPPPSTPAPFGWPSPARVVAADLRRSAAAACDEGRADDCLALLDEARAKDPAGDAAPEVARLREQAARQLEAKPRSPK